MVDPRVADLIAKYALAKGDLLIRRRERRGAVHPEVMAGWALECCGGDVLRAIAHVQQYPMPPTQRREVLDALRPLTRVLDLTKPLIQVAHR